MVGATKKLSSGLLHTQPVQSAKQPVKSKSRSAAVQFLHYWGLMCSNIIFSMVNQISFLSYYAILAIYAITNLVLLMLGLHVGLPTAATIAFLFTTCAIINELIDMLVTVNPKVNYYKAWFAEASWYWAVPTVSATAALTIALSLCEIYTRTINMVFLQLNSLQQYAVNVPVFLQSIYYSFFATTAVVYILTNALNLTHKYFVTNIFSGADKLHAKDQVVQHKSKDALKAEKPSLLARVLRWYLSHPWVTFTGSLIGASLYAIGDSMQMGALFYVLAQRNLLVLPALLSTSLTGFFFVSTLIERCCIWGYNFQHYNEVNVKDYDDKAYNRIHDNAVIDLMQQGPNVRSTFTYGRIMMVCVLNIAGGFLHFSGVARLIGILTSVGYYIQQRLQLSFQAYGAHKVTNKSDALKRLFSPLASNIFTKSKASATSKNASKKAKVVDNDRSETHAQHSAACCC